MKKAKGNASELERKIESLQEFASQHRYGDFWGFTREVVSTFKTLKPLLREDRENLWSRYQGICGVVKDEMQSGREKAKEDASRIEQEIENFRYDHRDPNAPFLTTKYRFSEFWQHAKEISALFKSSRLLREDRENLWSRYQGICDDAKRQQDELRAESEKNRGLIESLITDARNYAEGSSNKSELDEARSKQAYNLEQMKERTLVRADREYLWNWWKEANQKIFYKQQGLQESNYLHIREEVNSCLSTAHYGDPYEALNDVKGAQSSMRGAYMSKEQRQQLRDTLNEAWRKATSRISEVKEEKRRKREEWQRKHEDWQRRTESHIERWENNIEKAENAISKLEANIDKLEGMADNARTDEYADRVRGWIQENYDTISDIRESIKASEDKIYSARGKLNS